MRKTDLFWLAFHNLLKNKSKYILLFIVLFVNSLILMFILAIGFNTYSGVDTVLENSTQSSYEISINRLTKNGYETIHQDDEFIINEKLKYDDFCAISFKCEDTLNEIEIVEGANDLSIYSNTNSIILPISFKNEIEGILIGSKYVFNNSEFTIIAFSKKDIFIDFIYQYNRVNVLDNYLLIINYNPKYSYKEYIEYVRYKLEMYLDVGIIENVTYEIDPYLVITYTSYYNKYSFLGITLLTISLMLLLTSGFVSNTVMLSSDSSKRTIGIIQAFGMTKKEMFLLMFIEVIFVILASIILAYVILFAFAWLLKLTTVEVLRNLVASNKYDINVSFPFYIPLIYMGILFAFTSFFMFINYRRYDNRNIINMLSDVE